jgi:hypothetical protein
MKYHAIAYALVALLVCIAFVAMSGGRAPFWSTTERFQLDQYPTLLGMSILDETEFISSEPPKSQYVKKNVTSLKECIGYASTINATIVAGTWNKPTQTLSMWMLDDCSANFHMYSNPKVQRMNVPKFSGTLMDAPDSFIVSKSQMYRTSFALLKKEYVKNSQPVEVTTANSSFL